jgi:acyl phosphate:glycerol-3-phosphate acyltransferase
VPIAGYIVTALAAYLIGSIPTGFLVGKARGIDIRTVGSGNIGATNVFRALGTPAGVFVLLADAFKGWVPVAVVSKAVCQWQAPNAGAQAIEMAQIVAAVSAVLGHNYTVWLRFRGGKGIATSAGVLLALVPGALLIILIIWVVVFALSRYVSLASICASFALPFAVWLTGRSGLLIVVTALLAALAIYKHRSNIQRLLNGTENRFGKKPAPAKEPQSNH